MRKCSIDFGGSTIDVVFWHESAIERIDSYEREQILPERLDDFLKRVKIPFLDLDEIRVTGGKSHLVESEVQGVPVVRVDEIEAIGRGGRWLVGNDKFQNPNDKQSSKLKFQSQEESGFGSIVNCQLSTVNSLVVSMGTGTCMVAVRGDQCVHVGGTGVGGGTFLSLCHLLLNEKNPQRLIELFRRGDFRKVDLSVGDIVGRDIGRITQDVTASNLGKLNSEIDFSRADLAAGIVNLIGQTIGAIAIFAAQAHELRSIVLTGKLIRIEPILDIVLNVGRLHGIPMLVPQDGEFVSAIGAGILDEARAKKQEPRAKNQEPRSKSQEPRAKNQEPRTKNQEPRTKNQEPRNQIRSKSKVPRIE